MAVDVRILLFTAGTCLATGLACGLLPALRATNVDVASLIGRTLDRRTQQRFPSLDRESARLDAGCVVAHASRRGRTLCAHAPQSPI